MAKIKRDFENLEDFFSDWFYINGKTWLTLSEFVKVNKLEDFVTSRQVSDIILGRAYPSSDFSVVLSHLSPFEITQKQLRNIINQTRIRNRLSYQFDVSSDAIQEFENNVILKKEKKRAQYLKTKEPDYVARPQKKYKTEDERIQARKETSRKFRERARVAQGKPAQIIPKPPLTEEQKKEARRKISRRFEAKLSYQKKMSRLNTVLANIIAHKEAYGEKIERKVKKPRIRYNTEEERNAAKRASNKKANDSIRHQEWRDNNPDKVLQYGRNWRINNPEKEKEVRQRYKDANRETIKQKSREAYHRNTQPQRIEKLLGILRGIENKKEECGEEIRKRTPEEIQQIKKDEQNACQREYRKNKKQL